MTELSNEHQKSYLPDILMYEYVAQNGLFTQACIKKRYFSDLSHQKNILAIGVIGAFIPACNQHILGYIKHYKKLKQKCIDEIWCISVNDPFVLNAWSNKMKAQAKIRMLSDGNAEFCQNMNASVDICSKGLGVRAERYVFIMKQGKVVYFVKDEAGVINKTSAQAVSKKIASL